MTRRSIRKNHVVSATCLVFGMKFEAGRDKPLNAPDAGGLKINTRGPANERKVISPGKSPRLCKGVEKPQNAGPSPQLRCTFRSSFLRGLSQVSAHPYVGGPHAKTRKRYIWGTTSQPTRTCNDWDQHRLSSVSAPCFVCCVLPAKPPFSYFSFSLSSKLTDHHRIFSPSPSIVSIP